MTDNVPTKYRAAECLADIVENAARAEGYIAGMDLDRFASDGLTHDAVERCLERVCEAGHRLGDRAAVLMPNQPWAEIRGLGKQAAELMPDQPWDKIRGMGNRLRHAYDRIGVDVVWNAAREDLPGLVPDVRRALERLRGGGLG